jgi:transmembrane sensor
MSDQAGASRAEAEAARWFETLRQTSITTEAVQAFHAWKRDAANAEAFGRVEAGWKATGALAAHPEVKAATEELLARRPRRARRASGRRGWLLVAAPAALAGTLALGWFGAGVVSPTYSTAVGEQRTVALADGSRVRLNTDSAMRVWYWGHDRNIYLQHGQAYFEVAHDASRPFVVWAGAAKVRALGTKFDVRRVGADVAVVLVEGRVQVDSEMGAARELAPNQRLTVSKAGISPPAPTAAAESVSWTAGRLVWRGVPLRDAVADANRYSKRKIELSVPQAIADQPVSGEFNVGDVDAVVAALSSYYGLSATTPSPDVIRLSPSGGG